MMKIKFSRMFFFDRAIKLFNVKTAEAGCLEIVKLSSSTHRDTRTHIYPNPVPENLADFATGDNSFEESGFVCGYFFSSSK